MFLVDHFFIEVLVADHVVLLEAALVQVTLLASICTYEHERVVKVTYPSKMHS